MSGRTTCHSGYLAVDLLVYIIIIDDIYKEQTSPTQQMRQVSRYTITVILEQEHFQSFPEHWQ